MYSCENILFMFKVHSPQLNTDRKLVEPVGELVEPIRLTIRRQSRHLRCNFCSKLFQNHLGFNPILPGKPASYGRFEFKTCKSLGEGNHLKVAKSEGSPLLWPLPSLDTLSSGSSFSFFCLAFLEMRSISESVWLFLLFLRPFPPFLPVKQRRISRSEMSFKWRFRE